MQDWRSAELRAGACPVSRTIAIVGGKWHAMIIRDLLDGPRSFGQLQASLAPIAAKVLTEALRLLADYDIVTRAEPAGLFQPTAYSLTERGRSLRPVLAALWHWGVRDEASWTCADHS
jgi:DNA-binding HxlR family transcriptional regulator